MSKCMYCGAELTTGDYNGVCNQCRLSGFDVWKELPPYEPIKFPPQPGIFGAWICPRCGVVHAPWVSQCNCPPPSRTTDGTQLTIRYDGQ